MKHIDVTAAVIEREGRFLIAKRKPGKHMEHKWEFPGGKIEPLETPGQCLLRELKEEFGIETEIGDFMTESIFEYDDRIVRLLGYDVKYISGDFELNDHSEIKWVFPHEFDQYDFAPADLPIIQKIISIY